jgi:hypothetical protein
MASCSAMQFRKCYTAAVTMTASDATPTVTRKHALSGVSTYPIAPGQGIVVDAIMSQPGKYPIVDHSMRNMAIGAAGQLQVTPN